MTLILMQQRRKLKFKVAYLGTRRHLQTGALKPVCCLRICAHKYCILYITLRGTAFILVLFGNYVYIVSNSFQTTHYLGTDNSSTFLCITLLKEPKELITY